MKKTLKLDAQHLKRMQLREQFSSEYKLLNQLIRANTSSCYATLKYAFYDVKNGKELLEKKGLSTEGKQNKYLDYVDMQELKCLVIGLSKINKLCVQPNKDFKGYPYLYKEIYNIGRKLRFQFFKINNVYPENNPICTIATRYIKTALDKEKIGPMTNKKSLNRLQKEREILEYQKQKIIKDAEIIDKEINRIQNSMAREK